MSKNDHFIVSAFPGFVEREVNIPYYRYEVLSGSDKEVQFDPKGLDFYINDIGGPIDGVKFFGEYSYIDETGAEVSVPVVSFLYHKKDELGLLETQERLIILMGEGWGVHPEHKGQKQSEYLIGLQIGSVDHETGKLNSLQLEPRVIAPKHFSVACIQDGPYGSPVLANDRRIRIVEKVVEAPLALV
jgi:hypothetical protein